MIRHFLRIMFYDPELGWIEDVYDEDEEKIDKSKNLEDAKKHELALHNKN